MGYNSRILDSCYFFNYIEIIPNPDSIPYSVLAPGYTNGNSNEGGRVKYTSGLLSLTNGS